MACWIVVVVQCLRQSLSELNTTPSMGVYVYHVTVTH